MTQATHATYPLLSPWRPARVDCLGVHVARVTLDDVTTWFERAARQRDAANELFFVNAHTLNLAWKDAGLRAILNRAALVLNDGVGLELYAHLAGQPFAANFNGTDLIPRLLASPREHPVSVFLLGAAPGRAELAATRLERRFRGVRVVGARDGYRLDGALEDIARESPDLLLVGMGNPLQERWIDKHRGELDCGVAAGIGALIDFLSEHVPRAPAAVRHLRMEWAYRLALEPRRMFRRYVLGNPLFLGRAASYLTGSARPVS